MASTELEPVAVTVVEDREASYLFQHEDGRQAYFPKSETTFKQRNVKTGKAVALVPIWLLEKRGW